MSSPSTTTTTTTTQSRWHTLQTDILTSIATILSPHLGHLRLRSVCHTWRISLSLSPPPNSPSPHFPLTLPSPTKPNSTLSLHHHPIFLLSSSSSSSPPFLIKLQSLHPSTPLSLLTPLSLHPHHPPPSPPINLLDHQTTLISNSYSLSGSSPLPFKKVIFTHSFFKDGDFVVLGMCPNGQMMVFSLGDDVTWTEIPLFGKRYYDVVVFDGKFFATCNRNGRLVMIDSRLRPVCVVDGLRYRSGTGTCARLVVFENGLYLVDKVKRYRSDLEDVWVYKLDEKCRFWDCELELNDGGVFFVGVDVSFSLSNRDYGGSVRNCVFFLNEVDGDEVACVFDMNERCIRPVSDCKEWEELYLPPSSLGAPVGGEM